MTLVQHAVHQVKMVIRKLCRKIIGWNDMVQTMKRYEHSTQLMFHQWEVKVDNIYAELVQRAMRTEGPAQNQSTKFQAQRQCLVCKAPSHIWALVKDFPYYLCSSCAFLFADCQADRELLSPDAKLHDTYGYRITPSHLPEHGQIASFLEHLNLARSILPSATSFLEFGSGTQDLSEKLAYEPRFTFYEPRFDHPNLLPNSHLQDQKYDILLVSNIVHCVDDQIALFHQLRSLLKDNGICLMSATLHDSFFSLSSIDPTLGYISFHSSRSLIRVCNQTGLIVTPHPNDGPGYSPSTRVQIFRPEPLLNVEDQLYDRS